MFKEMDDRARTIIQVPLDLKNTYMFQDDKNSQVKVMLDRVSGKRQ